MIRLLWLSVLLVSFVAAGEKDTDDLDINRWSPELMMKYRTPGSTAVSPDGSRVAYVVREAMMGGEDSKYISQIWVYERESGTDMQYTFGESSASNPAFSPDGKRLAFTRKHGKKSQIHILRMSGGEAEPVTEASNGVGRFKWAPDGNSIVYQMTDEETEEEKKAKKEKRDVILVDQNFKYTHLYRVWLETKRKSETITQGTFHVASFDWAPDGEKLVISHQKDPRINVGWTGTDLSVIDLKDKKMTSLVTWAGADNSPLWSPDGKWIAFTSHGGKGEPIGLGDVFVVSAAGGDPKPLAHTHDRNANLYIWSPDSKHIYYGESKGILNQIATLPVNGGKPKVVSRGDGFYSAVSVSADGDWVAFTNEDPETAGEVCLTRVDNFEVKPFSKVNAETPKPKMGKTELITWKAPDGLEIEGLLTYPVDYVRGKAYPLILQVHGGPAGVHTRRYTGRPSIYMYQFFAQEGYAILRPNPRGSTGYGKDFRYGVYREWGYADYEDLMSGVDKVVEMGIGDEDRLLLMGWSYGGYMTSMMITKTDRFKAASMGAGLPNLVSMVFTTDIPIYLHGHMGGPFWENKEIYEKHSAIYNIDKVTTPTQIIHGENDLRVPVAQGYELYNALSQRGIDTEMVLYPRTPHGPREPKFVEDVSHRISKWFSKYLESQAASGK